MIITYFRSSSYNTYDWCKHKYFLEYVLGLDGGSNKKAEKGTIVHKALEFLAKQAIAEQTNQDFWEIIKEDDLQPKRKTLNSFLKTSYEFYSRKSVYAWAQEDLEDCKNWTQKAINYNDGMFDPHKLDIVESELFFDFEIDKPWAKYSYELPDGKILDGFLALKGTIDLVTRIDNTTLEIIDWKTGRRLDWATGKEKTLDTLKNDFQLRLYHYGVSHLFPEIENIIFTVFYINDGGPYSVNFEKKDLVYTEEMIRKRFEEIRRTTKPRLNITWKCTKLCRYGKTIDKDSGTTICETIKNEIAQNGIDYTMKKRCNWNNLSSYGMGGGSWKN